MSGRFRFTADVKSTARAAAFLAALVLCAFGFSACAGLQAVLREPLMSLDSVEAAGVDFNGVDLICTLNVENPNAFTIPFPHVDWELFINGSSFVTGTLADGAALKARQSTVVNVPLNLEYLEIFNTFKSLKGAARADYKIALGAKIPLPILESKTWNFEHEGTMPVPQMPKLSRPSIKVDKVDLTGVQLLCSVNVENPNEFELPAPHIAYDYKVNNTSLVKSALENSSPVAAKTAASLTIRLSVAYADVLRAVRSVPASGEVPGLLSLVPDFKIPAFAGDASPLEIVGALPLSRFSR